MKATALLEKQHRRVEAAFKKLEAGKSDPRPILEQLANELTAHMVIEEKLFYPATRAFDEDMVFESFEEHAVASFALARLLACDPKDKRFQARVVALKELIEHHVEEEEEDLFPKVDKKMDEQAHEQLGLQMKTVFDDQVQLGWETVLKRAPMSGTDTAAQREARKESATPPPKKSARSTKTTKAKTTKKVAKKAA